MSSVVVPLVPKEVDGLRLPQVGLVKVAALGRLALCLTPSVFETRFARDVAARARRVVEAPGAHRASRTSSRATIMGSGTTAVSASSVGLDDKVPGALA